VAFCFNEAVMYIQSFRYVDYEDDNKVKWRKTPHWLDEAEEGKPKSNQALAELIQKQMGKYK